MEEMRIDWWNENR